ncbi:hypothetical protein D9603_08015 [Pseudoalteromonas sp. PS5]|nr:hypothetical protein D9603_08015 [Pseudoalteromonas sp. PS5]
MSITLLPHSTNAAIATSVEARQKFCYLVVLNKNFLTLLASDFPLQIVQVLRLIGINISSPDYLI